MKRVTGFYQDRQDPGDTYTVQLEGFFNGDGWQAIDDIHFPRKGNRVETPEGYSDDVNGAETYAAKTWSVAHDVRTLAELAQDLNLSYDSIAKAAREGRIKAWQSGATWLSTISAIEQAIEVGHLRPRRLCLM
jgi:hypothetical protein